MPTEIGQRSSPEEIQDPLLRSRAQRGHGGRSLEFVAVDQGVEMGMLSYEDRSDTALAFVYEIFVLPQFRKRGVAAMLLSYAEAFAVRQQCQVVRLEPRPLDEAPDLSQLESWYMRAGYLRSAEYPELMEKPLPIPGQA